MSEEKLGKQGQKKRRFTPSRGCLVAFLILGLFVVISAPFLLVISNVYWEAIVGTNDWEFAVKRVLHLNEAPRLEGGHVKRVILGESTYSVWVYGDPEEIQKLIPKENEISVDDERPTGLEPVPGSVAARVKPADFSEAKCRHMQLRDKEYTRTTWIWINAKGDAAYIASSSWPNED